MKAIYEDVKILGRLNAEELDGALGEQAVEQIMNCFSKALQTIEALSTAVSTLQSESEALRAEIGTLVENYNNAIEVINDLSTRIAALESNYDPTVIK